MASTKNKYTLDALHFIAFSTAKAATPISQVNPFPVKKVQGDAEIRSFFVPQPKLFLHTNLSSSVLGLGHSLLDLKAPLLLQYHDFISIEVVQSPSLVVGVDSLGKSRVVPLLIDALLLPDLRDERSTSASW